jgi:phenylacetate-CoA ligase
MEYFDALETRSQEVRERQQMAALPSLVSFAKSYAPAYAELLAGVDAEAVSSPAALAALPVTRKAELTERQQAASLVKAGAAASAGYFLPPGRSTSRKGAAPTTGARRGRCSPPDSVPATWCTTPSRTT